MTNKKLLKDYIRLIDFYDSLDRQDITFCNYDERYTSSFSRNERNFVLETNENFKELSFENHLEFNINGKIYAASNHAGIKILSSHLLEANLFNLSKFRIYKFCSINGEDTNNSGYFRLIMNHRKEKLRLDSFFDDVLSIESDIEKTLFNGIGVSIGAISFHAYYTGRHFVIDSMDLTSKENFNKSCLAIITAIGFITGYSTGEYAYIFRSEDNKHISYNYYEFSSEYSSGYDNSSYSVVDSNIYNYTQNFNREERDKFVEEYKDTVHGLTRQSFSKLCESLLKYERFCDGVHYIIEARKSSVTVMSVLYSVSLEALSEFISNKNKDKIYLIEKKAQRKELCQKLNNAAKEYLESIGVAFDNSAISSNISNINRPTNKDKLTQVFKFLGIPISEDDLSIISKRNDFLHGNPLYNIQDDILESSNKLWDIALQFNFLLNAIVLKHIGHIGGIKNLFSIYKKGKIKEPMRII